MPLLDHFQPPTNQLQDWESVHTRWAVAICDRFNTLLPRPRYIAGVQVTLASGIEADIAEFEQLSAHEETNGAGGGVAVQTWAPPAATRSMPFTIPDDVEVRVFDQRGGRRLVGVVELVSPSNKDRPDSRQAFAGKCVAYLHRGVGVVVVDVVTERHGNLHRALMDHLGEADSGDLPRACYLYASAYRPVHREAGNQLDVWAVPLELGTALPTMPLVLRGGVVLPVDLEGTYQEARERLHL